MFAQVRRMARALAIAAVALGTMFMSATDALADKLFLKDGRVIEGTVVREGDGFVFFRTKIGTLQKEEMFTKDMILRVEKDDPKAAPKTDKNIATQQEATKTEDKAKNTHTGAKRIAILNFGPPSDWQGSSGDMVGVQISVEGFRKAIPILEKAKAEVVVIRVNSGGGYLLELDRFHEVLEKEYKPRFTVVAWIESAISAAAMSPWVIEDMYFFPNGNIGGCTGWSGDMKAVAGIGLEAVLYQMEVASRKGKRDPKIMRAMQIQEPLSYDIDENGNVLWRQDELGQHVLNKAKRVYTMTASEAIASKFGKGIASNKEELAKAMGFSEVEWVAEDATAFVDKNIRENDRVEKSTGEVFSKYQTAIQAAQAVTDRERRGAQLAIAKRHLAELRRMVKVNPNFEFHLGIPPQWFTAQDELIKRLSQGP